MQKLVLFDIDKTLIRSSTGHHEAFAEAFRKVYGIDTGTEAIQQPGMTDQEIIVRALTMRGLSEDRIMSKMDECMHVMVEYVEARQEQVRVEVLPGVPELLSALEKRQALIGHVTGNLEPIAMVKMEKAGLRPYFKLGGYGSDDRSRTRLVELAVRRAEERFGFRRNDNVFLFGDAPQDMQAGRAAGVKTVGTATGFFSQQDLEAAGGQMVLPGLEDTQHVMEILFS
jgi:phosphoglycolate phosphatase-like HAD superfamily hydrolase